MTPACTCVASVLQCRRHTRVRTRFEIVRAYAARHGLSVKEVAELVASLPGGERKRKPDLIWLDESTDVTQEEWDAIGEYTKRNAKWVNFTARNQ